jgi:hypothetical protein
LQKPVVSAADKAATVWAEGSGRHRAVAGVRLWMGGKSLATHGERLNVKGITSRGSEDIVVSWELQRLVGIRDYLSVKSYKGGN